MRKLLLLTFFTLSAAIPLHAATQGRNQSYISFDDGGTTVRQGDDGKEVEARLNFPVYPGDEVITNRRGRAEIRLSDGNVIALDRSTDVHLKSIRDSYAGDAYSTVVELRYGHIAVERDEDDTDPVRIDTDGASYVATEPALYAVDTDRGTDRIAVFDGAIEVRTPIKTSRMTSGEEGRVDDQGLYDLANSPRGGSDDFERWFIRRAELYRGASSRYLDRSLAYSSGDLDTYGSWVYVADYGGYCWRPRVDVGWRPYFYGSWHYGRGSLVWVSYEPWGWVPYHYGRWAYDPLYGWVWLPGYGYSPAWVYWMYGPGYVGWAPAGWYDCYRPYYGWAYRPYLRAGWWGRSGGFYGHVRIHDIDLKPWTFVSAGGFVGTRVDRNAINANIVRQRFGHEGFATVSNAPASFTRGELRDPVNAINNIARRGTQFSGATAGVGGRQSSATMADMTPFFRRDASLSSTVRDRVVRSRPVETVQPGTTFGSPRGAPSGVPTPGTAGTLEGRVGHGNTGQRRADAPPVPGTTVVPGRSAGDWRTTGGIAGDRSAGRGRETIAPPSDRSNARRGDTYTPPSNDRGARRGNDTPPPPQDRGVRRETPPPPSNNNGSWRRGGNESSNGNNGVRRNNADLTYPQRDNIPPQRDTWSSYERFNRGVEPPAPRDTWRGVPVSGQTTYSREPVRGQSSGRDVPRRVIDGVGGPRIYSGDTRPSRGESYRGGNSAPAPRSYSPPPPRSYSPPPQRSYSPPPRSSSSEHSSSGSSSHSSGNSGRQGHQH